MNWKCPACGADDNEGSSIQCACGYRLEGIRDEEAADKIKEKKEDRKLIRWTFLILSLAAGLFFLNSAFFCAWVSGGPPNDYPKAWLHQSYVNFGYSGAFIATGFMGFKGLRKEFNWKKSILFYIWVPFLLYCLGGPKVRELLLTDKCLDSGGRWDKSHFECKYK